MHVMPHSLTLCGVFKCCFNSFPLWLTSLRCELLGTLMLTLMLTWVDTGAGLTRSAMRTLQRSAWRRACRRCARTGMSFSTRTSRRHTKPQSRRRQTRSSSTSRPNVCEYSSVSVQLLRVLFSLCGKTICAQFQQVHGRRSIALLNG